MTFDAESIRRRSGSKFRAPARHWLWAILLAVVLPSVVHAGLTFDLRVYRFDGYYVFYPIISTNSTPPAAPLGTYFIRSPGVDPGTTREFRITPSGFEFVGGSSRAFDLFDDALDAFTIGSWSIQVTNATSTNTYEFTVSAPTADEAMFPQLEITHPSANATVPNQPTFTWTGPSDWSQFGNVNGFAQVHNNDFSYYESTSITVTQSEWTPPTELPAGDYEFYLQYVTNHFNNPVFVATQPLHTGTSDPIAGWISRSSIESSDSVSFTSSGLAPSGSHINIAHYDFEDGTIFTSDLSGNGNDVSGASSFGDGSSSITNDAASGSLAVLFDTDEGTGAGWLTPPTNSLLPTLAGSFSVSLWVKTTQISGDDSDSGMFGNAGLISTFSGPSPDFVIPMALTGSKLAFVTGGSSQDTLHSTGNINSGDYVHIVVTRNQTSGLKRIYINGVLDAQGSGSTDLLNGGDELSIGHNNGVGLQGSMDDIQIYSGVLSDAEVEFLFNNPGERVPDVFTGDLAEAVDAPMSEWSTGGDAPWMFQTAVTHDNQDAARSGEISDDQASWIETTIAGPGTLSFWWKISSDSSDYLEFYLDGDYQEGINGDYDWESRSFQIPPGTHTVRWQYWKDSEFADLDDAAYLDEVSFIESQAPVITRQPFSQTNYPGYNVALYAEATGNPEPNWQWYKVGSGPISGADRALYIPTNSGTAGVAGDYYALAFNDAGGALTHTATVSFVSAPMPPDWTRAFKSPATSGNDATEEYFLATHLNAAGDLYAAGSFSGTNTIETNVISSPNGGFSAMIIKQTQTGAPIWVRAITNDGMGTSFCRVMAPAPGDGIYIMASFTGTNWFGTNALVDAGHGSMMLARLNSEGETLWLRTFTGTNSIFNSYHQLVSEPSGNVTFSALFHGNVQIETNIVTGAGQYGVLLQFDANGNLRWIRNTSGWVQNLTVHNSTLYGSMSGGQTNFIGSITNVSDRAWALVALASASGEPLWIQPFGGEQGIGNPQGLLDDIPHLSVSGNNVFVVGNTWAPNATFGPFTLVWPTNGQYFARYGTDGTPQLAKAFGNPTAFYIWDSAADASGNVYVGADFDTYINFGGKLLAAPKLDSIGGPYPSHALVAKLDRDGNPLWARSIVAEQHNANIRDIELTTDGVWAAGLVKSPTRFGTNTIYSSIQVVGSPFGFIVWHHSGFLAKITEGSGAPLPLPVTILNPARSGNSLQFSFQSQSGISHTIQSRTNVASGLWQTRSNVSGDGTLKTLQFPATNQPAEFFRVISQ